MTKRIFDVVIAVLGLVVLSPLFLITALAIKIDGPGSIFFKQQRIGRGGARFEIIKFRTMRPRAERWQSITTSHDQRVTRVGRFLRRHKIDELPQLWNVILGQMSLVGPRPELSEFFQLYPP